MSNAAQETPIRFTQAKGTSFAREVFTPRDFWMSGLAMLNYIPRSFGVGAEVK